MARERWVRDTTFFLSGQTVSLLGSSLVQYSILWYLTLETQSGVVLTLATAFGFLPQAVMSVFGGVWADRHNRKLLLITADATIAATTLVLAIMLWNGVDALWLIYATLAIRSLGAGVQTPAVGALLPQIVPADKLMRVNGINMSIQSAMTLLAPALAAALFALWACRPCCSSTSSPPSSGSPWWPSSPWPRIVRSDAATTYFADLREGLSYVRHNAVVLRVLVFFAIVFVLMAPPGYLTPLMVVRTFGEDVWRLTVNELAFGVGMLAGGAVLSAWGGFHDRMRMLVATSFAFGILSVGLGVSGDFLGLPGSFAVFLGFMLLIGVGVAFFSTTATTLLQEQVDAEVQGRVFGLVGIVLAVAMPFGMLIFGPMADTISVEWILVLTGVLAVLVTFGAAWRAPAAPGPPRLPDAAASP